MRRVVAVVVVALFAFGVAWVASSPGVQAATGPNVSLGSVTVVESTSPLVAGAVKVPITLSQAQSTDVFITWDVTGGTATAGVDYKLIKKPKTAKIGAGKVRGFATVQVYGDLAPEGDETIQLTITAVTGAAVAIGTGTNMVTIIEDPPGGNPAVTIGSASVLEGDAVGVPAVVRAPITLSEPIAVDVLVTWSVTGGTATAGTDYKGLSKPKTTKIRAGKTTNAAAITLYGDIDDESDETIVITISGVVSATLSGLSSSTIAVVDDDTAAPASNLLAWGRNDIGQLGTGAVGNQSQPAPVIGGPSTDWGDASAGFAHTCAVNEDASTWCWGDNFWGEIGDGTTTNRSAPTQVGTGQVWRGVTAGGGHTCGVQLDGTAWCWGRNDEGQLGIGSTDEQHAPTQLGADADWSTVVAGNGLHSCGIRSNGTLWCWGDNRLGQLGDGTADDRDAPTQVGSEGGWMRVVPNGHHTCAVKEDGDDPGTFGLWCWGWNGYGQLGDGTTTNRAVPTQVGTSSDWSFLLSTGQYHSCAVKTAGTMWCWGWNGLGQLGDGTTTDHLAPNQVGSNTNWTDVAAGSSYTCGVRNDLSLWCWGWNGLGQLGDGTFDDRLAPVQTSGTANVLRVSASTHTVALRVSTIPPP
jgi:alpha-tubulin suppressor-like RCC1 family protein